MNGVPDAFAPVGHRLDGLYNVNGAVGGGEAGCNYQVGNWVWGVEIDGSWSAAEGQSRSHGLGDRPRRQPGLRCSRPTSAGWPPPVAASATPGTSGCGT